jgi:teichuronic acid biosynthesis glycosyltransferase TuaC
LLTQYFPSSNVPWGGHSAYQTMRMLARRVDLHVFFPAATYPGMLRPASASARPIDPAWQPADVAVSYIPYPVLPVVSRPLNGFVMANRLLPHVRRFQPDVILNYVVYPDGYAAVRVGKALGVPVVLTAIGSDLNRIPDALCAKLTRSALRDAAFTTTVSHDLAKTAVRLGAPAERVQAILNGCDTSVFHPQDGAAARVALGLDTLAEVIVYVGRLDMRKGLVELVEAMASLSAERPAARCFLVGDGPDKPLIEQAIARMKAEEIIAFVPPQPTKEVARWMAAADLVTLPSYREGCPNVVVEALAAGRPVVATNVGGIPELMDESCGRLVPAMDVPALARALDETLAAPWDAEQIAARHSRSWSDVADNVYEVLERTLTGTNGRAVHSSR